MTRACHTAVRMATGKAFTDEEIDDFLNRMEARAKRAREDDPTQTAKEALASAAQAMTKDELKEALLQKRMEAARRISELRTDRQYDGMGPNLSPAERLNALNAGSEKQGAGTMDSVDARGEARSTSLWGKVEVGLGKMDGLADRMVNFFGMSDRRFDRLVAREMARLNGGEGIEPTGDEAALHAARVFVSALKDAKDMQNALGAWIDELPGYVARQSHDATKIAGGFWREMGEVGARIQASRGDLSKINLEDIRQRAENRAFGRWRDFIRPRLDPRTFDGIEAEDVHFTRWEDDAQEARQLGRRKDLEEAQKLAAAGVLKDPTDLQELFLHRVWRDIVLGRHAEMSGADDGSDFRAPPSLARAVSRARVLHFKDPDAWADYAEKYGASGLYATVMHQLGRAGRNSALMETWGPSPQASFKARVERVRAEAMAAGRTADADALNNWRVRANFEAVSGADATPANPRAAQVMRAIRGWEAATKLGSIILSKTTDLVLSGSTMKRAGGTFLDGYKGWFDGLTHLGSADAKAAADSFDVGARSFAGHLGGQFRNGDGVGGWTSWATRLMYKIEGFQFMNDGVQKGAAQVYSRVLGRQADADFAGLTQATRETFQRFGITPADWDAARKGLEPADDGKTYLSLDKVADPALRLKFMTLFHNIIADTTGEARARERAITTLGTKPGTWEGEAMRMMAQLKGFTTAVVGRHLVPAARGYGGYKPIGLLANLIIGSALAGYLSMNAKQIVAGRAPRAPFAPPRVGDDGENHQLGDTGKTWLSALAQGGGLGIYGDFLFGEQNRNGAEFSLSQLAGPAISDFEQIATVVQQAIAGGDVNERTGHSPLPGELVRLAGRNIPIVNTWYTRLALDYVLLWGLQERASPGYLQRYEDRVRNQEGADFIVSPTSTPFQPAH